MPSENFLAPAHNVRWGQERHHHQRARETVERQRCDFRPRNTGSTLPPSGRRAAGRTPGTSGSGGRGRGRGRAAAAHPPAIGPPGRYGQGGPANERFGGPHRGTAALPGRGDPTGAATGRRQAGDSRKGGGLTGSLQIGPQVPGPRRIPGTNRAWTWEVEPPRHLGPKRGSGRLGAAATRKAGQGTARDSAPGGSPSVLRSRAALARGGGEAEVGGGQRAVEGRQAEEGGPQPVV